MIMTKRKMIVQQAIALMALMLAASQSIVLAFMSPSESLCHSTRISTQLWAKDLSPLPLAVVDTSVNNSHRRSFLATVAAAIVTSGNALLLPACAEGQDGDELTSLSSSSSDAFESIAARAARVSQEVAESELALQAADEEADQRRKDLAQKLKDDVRTIYDFTLPVNGKAREISELIGQTFSGGNGDDGWTNDGEGGSARMNEGKVGTRVKAILVVNMKQDDPIARKNIPELIELVTR